MTPKIIHYILTLAAFLLIDLIRLGLIARGFYAKQLAAFLAPRVNRSAALIFYAVFVVGILWFAVYPALVKQSVKHALWQGVLFGFFTYATYDMTNLATLADWPIVVVVVDIVRGALLCAMVAGIGYHLGQKIRLKY